jgi:hypothetical protein
MHGTMKRLTCIVSVKRVPLAKPLIRTDGSHAMTGKKWLTVRGKRRLKIKTLREKKSMVEARAMNGCM